MDTALILQNIAKHIQLDPSESDHFVRMLQPRRIARKQFLLREKDIAHSVAFVTQGCLRAYTLDENGFEHILQFAPADWWITDMYSFIAEQPAILNIDAIEHSEVLLLTRANQLRLFDETPKFERFFRIITEKSLVSNRQRVIDNLSLTARQRYDRFCQFCPTLINTLPQKQIAAYIGVTPEFLSKLRGRG